MKKKMLLLALCFMCVSLAACSEKAGNTSVQQTESSTASGNEQTTKATEAAQSVQAETTQADKTEAAQSDKTEAAQSDKTEAAETAKTEDTTAVPTESKADALTENQALDAVKNYCFSKNPDLKNMADSPDYTIYWNVTTNDTNEIVVLYRAYTGAEIRYYIDPVSGDTYVTESVPGITDGEQRTEEKLNVRDYLS